MAETLREIEFDEGDADLLCDRCGGEGWLAAADGDPSDWQEDTYCGPLDAEIKCRVCRGTGYLGPLKKPSGDHS